MPKFPCAYDLLLLRKLYKRTFHWQPVLSAPQPSQAKRLHVDGAGIFWQEGSVVYRMQYGAMEYIECKSADVAKALLKFVGDFFT